MSHEAKERSFTAARIAWVTSLLTAFCGFWHTNQARGDWPQWRGPERAGQATSANFPSNWPKLLTRRWRVQVGEGHASPIVVGDYVVQFARRGENEVVAGIDLATGKLFWQGQYAAPYTMNGAAQGHGKGPKSTPVATSDSVVTFGISGILVAWELKTGKQIWRDDFVGKYPRTSPLYGTAMSPLVADNTCFVHVGGHDNGALVGYDLDTGKVKWSWEEDGPAYCSPILANLGGQNQLITQSQQFTIGINPEDGTLLWKIPFTTDYDQNSVTPVIANEQVIISGYNQGVSAYKVTKNGEKWDTERVWQNTEVPLYMSSPVMHGNKLFCMTHRRAGQLVCLDVTSGNKLWVGNPRLGDNALLIHGGKVLLALTNDGKLQVVDSEAPQFQLLAEYELADTATWAHPALLPDGILIKDATHLTYWSWEE